MKNFVLTFLVGALVVFGHIALSFGKEKWSGELTVQYPLGYELSNGELHQYVQSNVVQQSSGSQTPELQGEAERVLVQFQ